MKVCPDFTEGAIEACLKDRGRAKAPRDGDACSLFKDISVFDAVSGLIDEEDREDVKKTIQKMLHVKSGKPPPAEEPLVKESAADHPTPIAPLAPQSASSSASPPTTAKRTIPHDSGVRRESEVQYLKPPVKGCSLSKDDRRFMRWSASYPRSAPPRLRSKVWTQPGWTERRSLLFAVQWLWQCHAEATGEGCPWDLEEFSIP